MIEGVLYSSAAFILFLIAHFLYFHYRMPYDRWRSVTRMAIFFLIAYTAGFWLLPYSNWFLVLAPGSFAKMIGYLNGVVIYIFLFLSYSQFYFLIDRSISARILLDIEESIQKRMTREEIKSKYDPNELQARRLTDMLYGGYIVEEGGYFKMTPRGKLHARVFLWSKKYLHLYPGG